MNKLLWLFPLLSGCLLNFSAFNEAEFLDEYTDDLCSVYVDCLDGAADGSVDVDDSSTLLNECMVWTMLPSNQGCKATEDKAIDCFTDLQGLVSYLENGGDCSRLWESDALPNCTTTYLDCPTSSPFGSVPPYSPIAKDPPVVTSIHPLHGPATGGTLVTLTGSGFDDETQVQFGGSFGSIYSVTNDTVVVYTPASAPGGFDVNVTNAWDNVLLEEPFAFWMDRQSLTGIAGYYRYVEAVGSYWSGSDTTHGLIGFVDASNPERYAYTDFLEVSNEWGSCTLVDETSMPNIVPIPTDYSDVFLSSETGSRVTFRPWDEGIYHFGDEDSTMESTKRYSFYTNAAYGWPEIIIEDVFTGPQTIIMSKPNLKSSSSSAPTVTVIPQMTLNWSARDGAYMTVRLSTEVNMSRYLGCVFADNGSAYISSADLSIFMGTGAVTYMEVCRVEEGIPSTVSPINNGDASFSGVRCILGQINMTAAP